MCVRACPCLENVGERKKKKRVQYCTKGSLLRRFIMLTKSVTASDTSAHAALNTVATVPRCPTRTVLG
jgi:hypothetical protein